MVPGLSWSLSVFPTPELASQGLADRLETLARQVTELGDRFRIAVSGGRTPADLYRRLGTEYAQRIPWRETDLFFADERAVRPEDPRSNYGLVERTLLAPLKGAGPSVHRIAGERTPVSAAAEAYESSLRTVFGAASTGPPPGPTFDVSLLGVGSDGHTASLFPNAASLQEVAHWTVVEPEPHLDPHVPRISLTLPVLRASRRAMFLVCGADKQSIVQQIFDDPRRGTLDADLPSARVGASEGVEWFLDAPSAPRSALSKAPTGRRGAKPPPPSAPSS